MKRLGIALAIVAACHSTFGHAVEGQERAMRVVSLIPATTEMLFALGAGDRLVGVGTYDRFPPAAARLPRVGGLLDPDTERILALKPDLVIVYDTQVELKQQLDRVGIAYYRYEHRGLSDIFETIRGLGTRLGLTARADSLVRSLQSQLDDVRRSLGGQSRPTTLLVLSRDPASLRNISASGGYGFLSDLLDVAGAENVFADVSRQSVQVSTETILERAPQVIVELRYGDGPGGRSDEDLEVWQMLASVPAVRSDRVYALVGDEFVVPGPRIVAAAKRLALVIHR